ncbi:hypothetical protein [Acetobacterium tundrae]|uniref:SMI1/KNR4 family protein n=1 Tax=Acetobacterium tundrae TaxID=132932 RepID=A0ABR6WKX5_9FIRM|nr:hypothetical protein [Acetobacterium tundrae]MBC3797153.1 hypothetical protein [Acetobacterium tundrae]
MIDKFESFICQYGNSLNGKPDLRAWEYFKNVYDEIPQEQRLHIQLESIYTHYPFDFTEFYIYLKKTLDEETPEQFKKRFKANQKLLKGFLDKDNFLTVYRGVGERNLGEEYAISYTADRKMAEWFANRFKFNENDYAEVFETKVHLNDVLFYTNCREEQEIIVKPECLEDLEVYFEDLEQYL